MSAPICGLSGCTNQLSQSRYDGFFKRTVCLTCFEKNEQHAEESAWGEWYEKNYKESDRQRSFWDRVGAFI